MPKVETKDLVIGNAWAPKARLGQKIKPSKTVQAPWVQGLGMLMLGPVFPILANVSWEPGSKP